MSGVLAPTAPSPIAGIRGPCRARPGLGVEDVQEWIGSSGADQVIWGRGGDAMPPQWQGPFPPRPLPPAEWSTL